MALSQDEINHIQSVTSIVDVIGSYVSLEKKGKNYFGLCPFHDDHSPSMSVSEDKKIYTCFVCGNTGNVFQFVQNYENVSFLEAVKIVAEKNGIDVNLDLKTNTKYDKFYDAYDLAIKYYQNNIKTADGKKALEYLHKRGLNDDLIKEFDIGYANKSNDTLSKLLINKGYTEKELIDLGLSNKSNTIYDLFRDRIVFPIHDSKGHPVAFSGRIYEKIDAAKYVNTKETMIFKKGEILFNYHRAINEAKKKKKLILVEGQMDAIRVYAEGIENVCATMGTALTNEHVKLLKKLNVEIVLCFDNDEAGEKATLAAGDLLDKEKVNISVLRLSGEKDPDEYILAHGVDAYQEAINNAVSFFDFKLNYLKKNKDLNKVNDVTKYVNSVIDELNKSGDPVLIDLTVNKLSEEYGIDKNVLLNKVIKVEEVKVITSPKKEKEKKEKNIRLIELLLFYMMNNNKFINAFEKELGSINNDKYQRVCDEILAYNVKFGYINLPDFISYSITTDEYEIISDIIENNINNELNDDEYIGLINKIKQINKEEEISKLKEQIKNTTDINEKLRLTDKLTKIKKDV
ncbi:MAG: DNA primase [Bacilli bacterium]|nr:DNA primase [Bacilli bacterium]